MVASDGGIFSYGDSQFYGSIPGLGLHPAGSGLPNSLSAPIVGMVPTDGGRGYFLVGADGGVFAFGDARFEGSCPGVGGCVGSAVAVMPADSGNGYWVVTNTGQVYAFGDAAYYGAPGSQSSTVTAAVSTGEGYYVLLANGKVFPYGDAVNFGSPPSGILRWVESSYRNLHQPSDSRLRGGVGKWDCGHLRLRDEQRRDVGNHAERVDH